MLSLNAYYEWKECNLDVASDNRVSSLRIQGIRGEFNFDYNTPDEKRTLSIRNIKEGEKGQRILQIGYSLDKDFIERHSLRDNYVYFLASVRLPSHLLTGQNYIFIQDYDSEWDKVRMHFTNSVWRKYLVSKKIRFQTTEIGIGFYFKLKSEEDEILIQDIQIYFLDHEI